MNFEAYMNAIAKSQPEDWTRVTQPLYLASLSGVEGGGRKWIEAEHPDMIVTCKADLSISMVIGLPRSPLEFVDTMAGLYARASTAGDAVATARARDLAVSGGDWMAPLIALRRQAPAEARHWFRQDSAKARARRLFLIGAVYSGVPIVLAQVMT